MHAHKKPELIRLVVEVLGLGVACITRGGGHEPTRPPQTMILKTCSGTYAGVWVWGVGGRGLDFHFTIYVWLHEINCQTRLPQNVYDQGGAGGGEKGFETDTYVRT